MSRFVWCSAVSAITSGNPSGVPKGIQTPVPAVKGRIIPFGAFSKNSNPLILCSYNFQLLPQNAPIYPSQRPSIVPQATLSAVASPAQRPSALMSLGNELRAHASVTEIIHQTCQVDETTAPVLQRTNHPALEQCVEFCAPNIACGHRVNDRACNSLTKRYERRAAF